MEQKLLGSKNKRIGPFDQTKQTDPECSKWQKEWKIQFKRHN